MPFTVCSVFRLFNKINFVTYSFTGFSYCFLWGFFEFFKYTMMSSISNEKFASYFPIFTHLISFFNLNALAYSWKTLLSSRALVWNSCLILDLHRIASITALLWNILLALGFMYWYILLYHIKIIHFFLFY